MKKIVFLTAVILSLGLNNVWAESKGTEAASAVDAPSKSIRTIKSPRFAHPLVEKWIEEYAKTEPGIEFQIVKGSAGQNNIDLTVTVSDKKEDAVIYIGKTAVLPITARSSEAARLLEGKHLNAKKLKQLFFLNDEFEEDVKKNKTFESINVYSGSNVTSVASSFAHNFGEESANFRGKRIAGDDLFLNTAIAKDPLGVSFNTLSNIFDLKSRHLKSDLSLIGIDVKKNYAESFSDEGSLDDVLAALESSNISEVAIENVGISYNGNDEAVNKFLSWVVEKGTKYNHQYGLLNR